MTTWSWSPEDALLVCHVVVSPKLFKFSFAKNGTVVSSSAGIRKLYGDGFSELMLNSVSVALISARKSKMTSRLTRVSKVINKDSSSLVS